MAGDSDAATEDNSDAAAAVPPDSVASFGDDCDNEAPLEYVVVFMPPLTCGLLQGQLCERSLLFIDSSTYRYALKGGPVLLSNSQAGPGRNFTQSRPTF